GSVYARRAMVFFLLHAAVLYVLNNSFSLLLISDFSASANHPRRDARARFDDGSAVCFAALCSRQRFAQRNVASSKCGVSRFSLRSSSVGEIQFHGANPDVARCFLFSLGKASMEDCALLCDLRSQRGRAIRAV